MKHNDPAVTAIIKKLDEEKMTEIELKPCPCCGAKADFRLHTGSGYDRWTVDCMGIICLLSTSVPANAKEFAAEMWNRRNHDWIEELIKSKSNMVNIGVVERCLLRCKKAPGSSQGKSLISLTEAIRALHSLDRW